MQDPVSHKAPAFLWYPKDYATDRNVQLMDWTQQGVYRFLLDCCWLEGSIPSDIGSLSRMTKLPIVWWEEFGGVILDCFVPKNGSLVNRRLERERSKQKAYREMKQKSGSMGAEKRWHKSNGNRKINGSAIVLPLANDSIPVSSLQFAIEQKRLFGLFYSSYPRKENPKKALEAFTKASIDEILLQKIIGWLEAAKKSEQWMDKSKIPHPTTFLNQRRWEGDPPPPPQPALFSRQSNIHDRAESAYERFVARGATNEPD